MLTVQRATFWILGCIFCSLSAFGQQNLDCDKAIVICSDSAFTFTPGLGQFDKDDFENPNNDQGCLQTRESDYGSAWFYFEFQDTMPPSQFLEMIITPFSGTREDFDFAIYGPNLGCDSLGYPLRCSYARVDWRVCSDCTPTGMAPGFDDEIEADKFQDGFVAPLEVQPGYGYYLIIDHWFNESGISPGFTLEWGGSAAPYLNCVADPDCRDFDAQLVEDRVQLCAGTTAYQPDITLDPTITNYTVTWQGTPEVVSMLNRTDLLEPTFNIPENFVGTLSATAVIADGKCSQLLDLEIEVLPPTELAIVGPTDFCPGDSIELNALGKAIRFEWSNGYKGRTLSVGAPGTYEVTATNSAGCTVTAVHTVRELQVRELRIQAPAGFCSGDTVSIRGTAGFESYRWADGITTNSRPVWQGGTYRLEVVDESGCIRTKEVTIEERPSPQPELAEARSICSGTAATLELRQAYQDYQWSTGATTSTLTVSQTGNYSVTVTDDLGCTGFGTFQVDNYEEPTVTISGRSTICPTETSELQARAGAGAYLWSTGEASDRVEVGPGTFSVTFTDANGCRATDQFTVESVPMAIREFELPDTTVCEGTSVSFSAPTGFTNYQWADGPNQPDRTLTREGLYRLTVTDSLGCSATAEMTLSTLPLPQPVLNTKPGFCEGDSVRLKLTETYETYQWSNGGRARGIFAKSAGTYAVTVTDQQGCTGMAAFEIDQFPTPEIAIEGNRTFCPNTSLELRAVGSPGTYTWSNGSNDSTIQVRRAGTIQLMVVDSNSCQAQTAEELFQFSVTPPDLPPVITICPGESTELRPTATYTEYAWSDGSTEDHLLISEPGRYYLEATDSNNCPTFGQTTLRRVRPNPIEIEGDGAICPGDSVWVFAPQGFTDIQWSTGSRQDSILITHPGNYWLEGTDDRGCRTTDTLAAIQFQPATVVIGGDSLICPGVPARLIVEGPFQQINWSTGDQAAAIEITEPGIYSVSTQDVNGCLNQAEREIRSVPPPELTFVGDTILCRNQRVGISLEGTFRTAQWEDGSTEFYWETSEAGTYHVQVTNEFGCQIDTSITIVAVDPPKVQAGPDQTVDCRGTFVALTTVNPDPNLKYSWREPQGAVYPGDSIWINQPGWYELQARDPVTGCRSIPDSVLVSDLRSKAQLEVLFSDTLTCTRTEVELEASLAESPTAYSWSWVYEQDTLTGSTTPRLTIDQAGTYEVVAFNDSTGCTLRAQATVPTDTLRPVPAIQHLQPLTCLDSIARLVATFPYDTTGLRLEWFSTTTDELLAEGTTFSTAQPGMFLLRTQDTRNGCMTESIIEVREERSQPSLLPKVIGTLSCASPEVLLVADPQDSSQYGFQWLKDGEVIGQTDSLRTSQPGRYYLEAINAQSGCRQLDSLQVAPFATGPEGLRASLLQPICATDTDGYIDVTEVIGGTAPLEFQLGDKSWSNQRFYDELTPGAYPLAVRDANGCRFDTIFTIMEGNLLTVDAGPDREVLYGSDAMLTATIDSSGQSIIGVDWQASGNRPPCLNCRNWLLDSLQVSDTYTVQVTDENGCTAVDSVRITISQEYKLYIPTAFSPNGDGVNDLYHPYPVGNIKRIKSFQCFNRWGNLVHQRFNFTDVVEGAWDGRLDGKDAAIDVYVYLLEVEFADDTETKVFQGDFTLIR